MPDLTTLEADLSASLPTELATLAPDLARTLQSVAQGQVSVDQARLLLTQPLTLAVLREMLQGPASPVSITVGDIYQSQGVAIGPNARVIYQGPGYPRPDYPSEVAARLQYLQSHFVGRESLLRDLTTPGAAGYTVVTAPAGFGKSALSAQLVARAARGDWPVDLLYVFLRQETGEHTPIHFLQRLNAQLLTRLQLEGGVPSDLEALRSQFSALWARWLETSRGPAALLVDGLDEMEPGAVTVATLLPDRVGPEMQILVTSRPNPDPASVVPAGHPLAPGRRFRVPAFDRDDLAALLRHQGAPEASARAWAAEVLTLSQGEPLLARFIGEEAVAAGGIPPALRAQAPRGVRDYFARQVAALTAAAEGALTRDVLGTLTVARGGLTRRDLADLLEAEPVDVARVLKPVQRFLLGRDRLELMHLELREALRDEFSPKHLRACTTRLLTWCAAAARAGWPADTPLYVLEHSARHLEEAGDVAGRLALVTDAAFRAAQRHGLGDIERPLADVRAALLDALGRDDAVGVVACAGAYRETLQHGRLGETVFAALDAGEPAQALRRAALCGADGEWSQVLWAYLAWEFAGAGDLAQVQTALAALSRAVSAPMDSLVDALLVATARALAARAFAGHEGRTAAEWLSAWGRVPGEALLAAYPLATADREPLTRAAVTDLEPFADHLIAQIQNDARSGLYEAVAMLESDNEEDTERIRDLRERLAAITALPEGRALVERLARVVLPNPYPFYRDQALITLGVAALAAPAEHDPDARAWLRRQLRAMLAVALTAEGVTFTFALPAQILALDPPPGPAVAELQQLVGRGQGLVDRWGTLLRTRLATVGAAVRAGQLSAADARRALDDALRQPVGFAGFAVTAFLAAVDLCGEIGLDPRDLRAQRVAQDWPLLEAASRSAAAVRDPDFRARRAYLVHVYRAQWHDRATPAPEALADRLSALPERDVRLAFLSACSARWSRVGQVDRAGLRALIPFALSDASTLDTVLARWLGTHPGPFTPAQRQTLAELCVRDLAGGRPWDYPAAVGPDEPSVVA